MNARLTEAVMLIGLLAAGVAGFDLLIALAVMPYAIAILRGGWLLKACGVIS